MRIVKVVVDELPASVSKCEAVEHNLTLAGVNSNLCRIFCKFDINSTKTQLMSVKEIAIKRCPNCPLVEELEEAQRWIPVGERLPDTKIVYDKFDVIVEFENIENGGTTRCVELMSYDYRNKSWNDDCGEYGFYPVVGVTHWRERPTPPEVQE